MIMFAIGVLLKHPVSVCYAGFVPVYLTLAYRSRHDPVHAAAYGCGAVLAVTLAACTASAG